MLEKLNHQISSTWIKFKYFQDTYTKNPNTQQNCINSGMISLQQKATSNISWRVLDALRCIAGFCPYYVWQRNWRATTRPWIVAHKIWSVATNIIQLLNRHVDLNATAAHMLYFRLKGLKLQLLNLVSMSSKENYLKNKNNIYEPTHLHKSQKHTWQRMFHRPWVLILPVTRT